MLRLLFERLHELLLQGDPNGIGLGGFGLGRLEGGVFLTTESGWDECAGRNDSGGDDEVKDL